MHAHFDCFGGAAGDMMLAACIDAADTLPYRLDLDLDPASADAADDASAQGPNSERLLSRLIFDLEHGLPELKGEFRLSSKRVWRSAGMIAARKVDVSSVYDHKAAPVPGASVGVGGTADRVEMESMENSGGGGVLHSHDHRHDHDHHHHHQENKHHDHNHDHHHNHRHVHDHQHHSSSSELKEDPHTNNNHVDDNDDINNEQNIHDEHSHNHDHTQRNNNHHHHDHSHSRGHNHSHGHGHDHHHNHHHSNSSSSGKLRNLPQISKMLQSAPSEYIPFHVARLAIDAFTALAHAEMSAHGSASIEDVHFHEVGAVDSIVDTVGTLLALYHLGVDLGGGQRVGLQSSEEDGVESNNNTNTKSSIAVTCSALPLGEGTVMTDHGLLPVPAPAALRLLIGMPTCPGPMGPTGELVTPTAAALLRVLTGVVDSKADLRHRHRGGESSSSSYWQPMRVPGRPPRMVVRAVGLGAGSKDFERHANVLRLILGDIDDDVRRRQTTCGGSSTDAIVQTGKVANDDDTDEVQSKVPMEDRCLPHYSQDVKDITTCADSEQSSQPWDMHTLTHIEANIDDATPELLAHALNLLLENGAIDAWINPIIMKKGRPAHTLHCLCRSDSTTEQSNDEERRLLNTMFRHTTTVGIRIHRNILRAALKRRFVEVQLPYTDNARHGRVDVKISSFNDGEIISVKPEFDHCKILSEESGIPLKDVSHEAERLGRLKICEESP